MEVDTRNFYTRSRNAFQNYPELSDSSRFIIFFHSLRLLPNNENNIGITYVK